MADAVQSFAEGGEAFRYRWEQFCTSGTSENHDKDASEDDVGHDLVGFQRCHDLSGKTFAASAIIVGHVCDRVEEHPDE